MLKWSPEPFDVTPAEAPSPVVSAEKFQSTGATVDELVDSTPADLFRRESGFADSKSLMASLTQEERSQVYELVEMDLVEEYQEREKTIRVDFEKALDENKAENNQKLEVWTQHIVEATARELKAAADASSRLAVQIAEKIVRRTLTVDPEVLARVIETTLYKIPAEAPITIQANPDDATWLEDQPALCERLKIGRVIADRRVEPGGCVIQADGREWDATLTRQLDTLAEIVNEAIATNEVDSTSLATPADSEVTATTDPEADNDPAVE